MSISLDEAVELTRTGDVWVFRGRSVPDRAIQSITNSPVNHVGMAVVLDDMPPLMWHAELGRSLPDMWTGTHQRGVQLHDLRDAVCVWANRYGQRAWLRQLDPPADAEMEGSVLRTIARLDGTPFPSTAQLAWRWVRGRVPAVRLPAVRLPVPQRQRATTARERTVERDRTLETAYCAEVVAVTYEAMGLLPPGKRPNWYDPGRFWSGDDLGLQGGAQLGSEIEVRIPTR
ncbi:MULTISPECIES: hypothetical protein [unclassified Micromonospora]|uniref:hypothetical protein n=1 Tax=unclassified Micromonospora TaxID=2617518 RepID=UPI0010335FE3|nr:MULTISPECIES: hypothetical protein [unclassified Micromonospora]QKW15242.1 hypothetical protein HUT12_22415 [Verrucosispora sp. NA02020]TBL28672.1 hypothetical protein EYA84_26405 [Verrucosispora sp. SN26_14.1]